MFRKISSAAAHSFSSLASSPNGNFSSLLTRPPKPTPLNSKNSTSRFTIPAETTSSCSNNWLCGPKVRLSTARLQKFLQTDCRSGDVSPDEAFRYFHLMVQMEPTFGLYSFNLLLRGLAENKRYSDALSLSGKMNSVGLIPNFVTLNILLKCLCYANRVSDGFLVMGRIVRMGYRPNSETLNSLFEGLLIMNRVDDAVRLSQRLEDNFDCFPDWNTYIITKRAIDGFEKKMIAENDQYTDSLCIEGKEMKLRNYPHILMSPAINHSRSISWLTEHFKGKEELKRNIHS